MIRKIQDVLRQMFGFLRLLLRRPINEKQQRRATYMTWNDEGPDSP